MLEQTSLKFGTKDGNGSGNSNGKSKIPNLHSDGGVVDKTLCVIKQPSVIICCFQNGRNVTRVAVGKVVIRIAPISPMTVMVVWASQSARFGFPMTLSG